jgi:16S rRNA (uracil1498-N3)-methyltransferase
MTLFYSSNISDGTCTLDPDESAHCVRVLHLAEGKVIRIIDGRGTLYEGYITEANPKCCKIQITDVQHNFGGRSYFLHIGIAMPKSADRCDWFLEKAAEIGIDCITPLLCSHSERKVLKHEHSQKILIAAVKQSLSAYVPNLQPMTGFANFVKHPFDGVKCIAYCGDVPRIVFGKAIENRRRILVLIGAEGDFSPSEVELAVQNGYVAVSLGNRRLRTETAGIVACHTAAIQWTDGYN